MIKTKPEKILINSLGTVILGILMLLVALVLPVNAKAASCTSDNIRWASSSNNIYISGPVSCTLSEIKSLKPTVPLVLADTANKIWLLKANIIMEKGAKLVLNGTSLGGDTNELRLLSNNTSSANSIVFIRAYWGEVDINKSKITSWDETASGPDTEYATFKRSYIQVRSFLDADGTTARESRMNIVDSEIGYLGYPGAEAYGLAWKVLGSQPNLYDKVNVYGTVTGSNIHHNYFGAYTFGADGMLWQNNQIHDNVKYGLDPHDDSDNLTIEGNNLYNNGNHGLICSQRCNNLTIRNNTSHNNTGNGIMLHRNTNDSLVENNTVNDNSDSGLAIFDSHNNTIRGNTSLRNKNGIRLSVGSSQNRMENNEFGANTGYGIYFYKGSDAPTSGDGRPKQNQFVGNNVHDNKDYMIKLKEGDNNTFENNTLSGNVRELVMENAHGNTFINNSLSGNTQNFYHAKLGSNGAIKDTPQASVKIGDTASSLDIVNSQNKIFQNTINQGTVATPSQTSVTLLRSLSSGIVTFVPLDFSVKPASGEITVNPSSGFDSQTSRKWAEGVSVADISANHTLGNLSANTSFDIIVNNTVWKTLTSDSSNKLAFTYDGGYINSSNTFEIKESLITTTPTPAPSATEAPAIITPELTSSPTPSPTVTPNSTPATPTETPLETATSTP